MAFGMDEAREFASDAGERIVDTGKEAANWVGKAARSFGERGSWAQLAGVAAVGFVAGAAVLSARKAAMQATTALPGDWFAQLKTEHRLAETLFDALLKTKDHETGKRTALFAKLSYALLKHGLQEETVIYPALRDSGGANGSAKHLASEHFDIKTFLHELSETPKDDPRWIATLRAFNDLVRQHVREEEEEIFPPFHEQMSDEDNRHLTRAMNREGIKLA